MRSIFWTLPLLLAVATPAAAKTGCGRGSIPIPSQFIGKWESGDGYSLEIRPHSWVHSWQGTDEASKNAAEAWASTNGETFDSLAKLDGKSHGEVIACTTVNAEAIIKAWGGENLPDEASNKVAARLRKALPKPPYHAIRARYYEAVEYVILLDATHVFDFWDDSSDLVGYDLTRKPK